MGGVCGTSQKRPYQVRGKQGSLTVKTRAWETNQNQSAIIPTPSDNSFRTQPKKIEKKSFLQKALGPQEPPHFITLTRRLQEEQTKRLEMESQNSVIVEKMRHYQERMIDLLQEHTKESVLVIEKENELARLRGTLKMLEKEKQINDSLMGETDSNLRLRIAQLEILSDLKQEENESLRRQLSESANMVMAANRKLNYSVCRKQKSLDARSLGYQDDTDLIRSIEDLDSSSRNKEVTPSPLERLSSGIRDSQNLAVIDDLPTKSSEGIMPINGGMAHYR